MDVLPDKEEPIRPTPVRKRATKPKAETEVPVLELAKRNPRVGTSLNDVTVSKPSEPAETPVKTKKTIRLKKPSKQDSVAL
jgi:hypothetical protein